MSSKEVVSRSLPPSDESYYHEEEEGEASDSDEEGADLREYGLAPSLPTTTAEAFVDGDGNGDDDDDEIVVDESEGFSAALRYLASVRLEARTVPQTVVAESRQRQERQGGDERETSAADREQAPPLPPPPPPSSSSSFLPASASDAVSLADPWLQAFLDDFAELRRSIMDAREVEHRDAWRLGAVEGRKKRTTTGAEEEEEEEDRLPRSWRAALGLSSRKEQHADTEQRQKQPRRNPSARFLAFLPQPEIVDALECVAEAVREFLEEEEEAVEEEGGAELRGKKEEEKALSSSSAAIITPAVALWTFSLAANLERPVPPHASAALSALGKAAGAEAKRMRRKRKEEDEEDEEEEEEKGAAAAAAARVGEPSSSSPPSSSFLAASSPCPHAAVVAAVCGAYFVQCEMLSSAAKEGWP